MDWQRGLKRIAVTLSALWIAGVLAHAIFFATPSFGDEYKLATMTDQQCLVDGFFSGAGSCARHRNDAWGSIGLVLLLAATGPVTLFGGGAVARWVAHGFRPT